MTLYREDLDNTGCAVPGCDHKNHEDGGIFMHGKCHMEAGSRVQYLKGELIIRCGECESPIAIIAVASRSFMN